MCLFVIVANENIYRKHLIENYLADVSYNILYNFLKEYFFKKDRYINPLVPEFCFPFIFEILHKSGSYVYRLIGATLIGIFFDDPFFF